jgi:hypothetical protein
VKSIAALERAVAAARRDRLYPAVVLHGADDAERRGAAARLARTLLCERPPAERPCGDCRHCRRIDAEAGGELFHPDFALLERDLKTATSAERTREFLRPAHQSPFEARGQVFVVAEAGTLSGEASDALLKLLEEPGLGAPRHFLLLAPSRLDLSPTVRSRAQAIFLGAADPLEPAEVEGLAGSFAETHARFRAGRNPLHLLEAATRLAAGGDFDDARASRPWTVAAAAVRGAALAHEIGAADRRALYELAEDLLVEAPALRLRGIPAERILEGLVARRLAG